MDHYEKIIVKLLIYALLFRRTLENDVYVRVLFGYAAARSVLVRNGIHIHKRDYDLSSFSRSRDILLFCKLKYEGS